MYEQVVSGLAKIPHSYYVTQGAVATGLLTPGKLLSRMSQGHIYLFLLGLDPTENTRHCSMLVLCCDDGRGLALMMGYKRTERPGKSYWHVTLAAMFGFLLLPVSSTWRVSQSHSCSV